VKIHTAPGGKASYFWYDYEKPPHYPNADADPAGSEDDKYWYDTDDYRGNVTYMVSPAGLSWFEYETDDEEQAALGRLVKKTEKDQIDASGKMAFVNITPIITTYKYTRDGRLTELRTIRGKNDEDAQIDGDNPQDYLESWDYGAGATAQSLLQSHTSALGLITTYQHDSLNRLETTESRSEGDPTDPADDETFGSTEYGYDAAGFLETELTYHGAGSSNLLGKMEYDFDPHGLLRSQTTRDGNDNVRSDVTYEYAPDGLITATIDGRGVRNELHYDKAGLLVSRIAAVGAQHRNEFLGQNNHTIEETTHYQYFDDGRLKSESFPDGTKREYFYDVSGRIEWTSIDGVAGQTTINPVSIDNAPLRMVTRTTYDEQQRIKEQKNLLTGAKTEYEYQDVRHDLPTRVKETFGAGINETKTSEQTIKYDARGNVLYVKENERAETEYRYDELSHLVSTVVFAADGQRMEFKTSPLGQVIESTEKRKVQGLNATYPFTNKYEYDALGRLRKAIDPLTDKTASDDPAPQDEKNASPATVTYEFDSGYSKVVSRSRIGIETIQWFNGLGQLVGEQNAYGGLTTYDYDNAGNLTDVRFIPKSGDTLPARHTSYVYDQLNRARQTIQKDAGGNILQTTYHDYLRKNETPAKWTAVTTEEPSPGFRLATAVSQDSLGTPIVALAPAGAIAASVGYPSPVTVFSYAYDSGSLQQVVTTTQTTAAPLSSSAAVDVNGAYAQVRQQRLTRGSSGLSLKSELANDSGGWIEQETLSYDAAGRLAQSQDARDNVTRYFYDDDGAGTGKLARVEHPSGEKTFYQYDSSGRLTKRGDKDNFNGFVYWAWDYDAIGRLTAEERKLRSPTSSDPYTARFARRIWTYEGTTTKYADFDSRDVITTLDVAQRNQSESYMTSGAVEFQSIITFHSDGSVQEAEEVRPGTDNGSIVQMTYDALGRQVRESRTAKFADTHFTPSSIETSWSVDAQGAKSKIVRKLSSSTISTTTYRSDGLGRVVSIADDLESSQSGWWIGGTVGEDKFVKFSYLANGAVATIDRFQGLNDASPFRGHSGFTHRYDGHVLTVSHFSDPQHQAPIARHEWQEAAGDPAVDPSGRVEIQKRTFYAVDQTLTAQTEYRYTFNAKGELRKVSLDDLANPDPAQEKVIDAAEASSYVPGAQGYDNRIYGEQLGDDKRTYEYDDEGNLKTRKTEKQNGNVETLRFKWDHKGRLLEVDTKFDPAAGASEPAKHSVVRYFYDAVNRLVGRQEQVLNPSTDAVIRAAVFSYVHDPAGVAMEILESYQNGGATMAVGEIARHYLLGSGSSGVLSVDQADTPGVLAGNPPAASRTAWMFADAVGTVMSVGLVTGSGSWERVQRVYGELGNVVSVTGHTNSPALAAAPGVWRGLRFDEVAGVYTFGSSAVDPVTGRFLSQEGPTEGNPYTFATDRLSNYESFDPFANVDDGEYWTSLHKAIGEGLRDTFGDEAIAGLEDHQIYGSIIALSLITIAAPQVIGVAAMVGGTLGAADGVISTYAANPDATFGEYVFGAGLGAVTGAINPWGAAGSLAGGAIGAAFAGRRGYLVGSFIGGIATGNIQDFVKAGFAHAAKRTLLEGAVAGGTFGVAYFATGRDLDRALFYGNMGSMVGGAAAARWIKCFVAGTPVLVPLTENDAVPALGGWAIAGLLPPEEPALGESWWRIPVGFGLIATAAVAWAWDQNQRRKRSLAAHSAEEAIFGDEAFDDWLADALHPLDGFLEQLGGHRQPALAARPAR
jgi:YD repeat-containing protein